jgi:ABC-2 type transport system ATP-binding protein
MIEVDALTKRYGDFTAVDGISFTVQPGLVTGFLGPNGAGKSTAMRMMCGLTPPTSGSATVLGVPYAQLSNPGRHVGVLLDASAQHQGRTGREVLILGAMVMGLPETRVDEMLALVGLTADEAKRRIGNYSLGMRQRLGIAHALLGDPQVLILDEPANGLDPAGIRWMRGLLRGFADKGGTVLLSSHLLHEIEVIADQLVVIGRGKIVAQGSKAEMLASAGTLVRVLDADALRRALTAVSIAYSQRPDGAFIVEAEPVDVGRAAATHGVVLVELRAADTEGLEDVFIQLTAPDARDGQPPPPPSPPPLHQPPPPRPPGGPS